MIRPGFETPGPFTRTRSVVVQGAEETSGRGRVIDVHCPGDAPAAILEHVHERWTETLAIPQGSASDRLGGEERAATLRTLTEHGGYDAAVPMPLLIGLSSTLGGPAEALGCRGVHDRNPG